MATKITVFATGDYDMDDLVSVVRLALLKNGVQVDSVDACSVVNNAVLYVELGNGDRKYVFSYEADKVDWTDNIDVAQLFTENRNIERARLAVKKISGITHEVLGV